MFLERFHLAQNDPVSGYANALREIQEGRKTSHWIWYIFPQLEGLGHSGMARDYAIHDLQEACDYLQDPVLRQRYLEIAETVLHQLEKGIRLETLMGSRIDALKLVSSLTLFHVSASRLSSPGENTDLNRFSHFLANLLQSTACMGYPPCTFTLSHLAR